MSLPKKSPAEITALFRTQLLPIYRHIGILQSQLQMLVLQLVVISVVLYFSSILVQAKYPWLALIFKLALAVHAAYLLIKERPWEVYKAIKTEFKVQVIQKIAATLGDGISFNHECDFPSEYHSSGIFEKRPDLCKAEDMIFGVVDGVDFNCREIYTAEKIETRGKNGRKQTRYVELFRGLFFVADFHKTFKGRTIVQADSAEKLLGFVGRGLQKLGNSKKLVELEDPEFEKHFKVTSDDQQEARYILSVNFMQKILELRNKFNVAIQLAFVDSKIVLAIPSKKDRFEFKGGDESKWELDTHEFYVEFMTIIEIIEELQLNSNVWGQQRQSG